jgi:hypothetical protein
MTMITIFEGSLSYQTETIIYILDMTGRARGSYAVDW